MNILFHLFCGLIVAFVGVIPPGLLNMTAVKISAKHGNKPALVFAMGASLMVVLQVYVAVVFAKFLTENPNIVAMLERVAVGIFIILSIFFFIKARFGGNEIEGKVMPGKVNLFVQGLFMSLLNVFPIPFYLAFTAFLSSRDMFTYTFPEAYIFIIAAALGTMAMLSVYIHYTKKFGFGSKRFSRNVNYVLSSLTLIIAIFTLIRIW